MSSIEGRAARRRIAARAAREVGAGDIVNLGVGIPNLIPEFLDQDAGACMHTENGLLGVGPRPRAGAEDPDLVDAAKLPVTALTGAACFDSATSFAMIRGGHVDIAILGALQVSSAGDIANWSVPGAPVLGVGGAMDLVVGARRIVVTMRHTTAHGAPKLLENCTLPLTAPGVVDTVVTEMCVFRLRRQQFVLTELQGGATISDVEAATGAPIQVELDRDGGDPLVVPGTRN